MGLVDLVTSSAWAIRPEALAAIIALVEREDIAPQLVAEAIHFSPARVEWAQYAHRLRVPVHAVAAQDARAVDGATLLTRRGDVGVIAITGPIVRRGNLFTSMSGGATSVDVLSKDLARALADPSFRSLVLDVDSPGGEANGIAELADQIYAGRSQKPILAYISDLGASAAYWLASAASEIVVAETAAVGSIGVVAAVPNPHARKSSEIDFVSSVSPQKRADPTTQAGAAQYQALVDALGQIFVESVARHRDVSTDIVTGSFGAGGLKVGRDAVAAGMADRLGSFEGVLRDLEERSAAEPPVPQHRRRVAATTSGTPVVVDLRDDARVAAAVEDQAPARGWRNPMSSLRERLMALLSEPDTALAIDGSADQEASIVSTNLPDAPGPITGTGGDPHAHAHSLTPHTISTGPVGSVATSSDDSALRTRLAQLEAENQRMRVERIRDRAEHFATTQQSALKLFDPQRGAVVALYAQLAADDEVRGAIRASDGSEITRVQLLANYFAAVPSRKELTAELLDPEVHQVLAERRRTPRRGEDDEPDAERLAELLAHTSVGRQILKDAAFSPNGASKH